MEEEEVVLGVVVVLCVLGDGDGPVGDAGGGGIPLVRGRPRGFLPGED